MTIANQPAEAALISRILVDPGQFPLISLAPEDFYTPAYRNAWRAMGRLSADNRPIDVVTLGEMCPGEDFRTLLSETTGQRAPASEYAEMIRRTAIRRSLVGKLDHVIRIAQDTDNTETVLAALNDAVNEIAIGSEDGRLISPERAVAAYQRTLEKRRAGQNGLTWGIPAVDRLMQPLRGGEMVVIAARPSVGKTALAETLCDHFASESGRPVLFASLEMSLEQLIDRSVSRLGGIEANKVRRGSLDADDTARQVLAIEARKRVSVWYLDDPYATTASVRAAAAKIRLLTGSEPSAIVIDYLQLLKDAGEQDNQRVARISRNTKAIAREFNCPVIALSQLNRMSDIEGRRPQLRDLRDSGAIEQDADIVMFLWRSSLSSPVLELNVAKNRSGQADINVELVFDLDRVAIGGAVA